MPQFQVDEAYANYRATIDGFDANRSGLEEINQTPSPISNQLARKHKCGSQELLRLTAGLQDENNRPWSTAVKSAQHTPKAKTMQSYKGEFQSSHSN